MRKYLIVLIAILLLLLLPALAEGNRSISINATETVVNTSEKIKLSATVDNLTEDAPVKTALLWVSSDKAIAKVDNKGNVTGIASGKATITCQAQDDKSISASVEIYVRNAVKALSLDNKQIIIFLGVGEEKAQAKLTYSIMPEDAYDKSISWTSSDEKIATVDANGIVHAIASGKAVISAKSNDPSMTKAAMCTVTVGQAVSSIELVEDSVTMEKGKRYKAATSILPKDALISDVAWSSSNDDIVKVDAKGIIMAKDTGTASVTCTAIDGSGVSSTCNITVVQKVTKVSSKTKKLVLFQDQTLKIAVNISPSDATNKAVNWSSSRSIVASVDGSGNVTAKNVGDAVITALAVDGSGKKCNLKVIVEPANPISLESIGFGVFLPNLLGLTVENKCKSKTITDFDFDMGLYSYNDTTIDNGSYSLGKATSIGANRTKTIKRTVFGAGYAMKVVITITAVSFSDGTYYSIPSSLRETWTFTR